MLLDRYPESDGDGNNKKWSEFILTIASSTEDLTTIQLSNLQVSFLIEKTRGGNDVAHGEDKIRIAAAITALSEAESSRDMWKSLFLYHYGEDIDTYFFSN